MDEQRPWYRLFGLSWTDFFRGLPVTVELEKDLSVKKQLLDVLLIRKETGVLNCRLPDGLGLPFLGANQGKTACFSVHCRWAGTIETALFPVKNRRLRPPN